MLDPSNREQSRAFDAFATNQLGLPGLVLMENAGRGAVDALLVERGNGPHRVLVLCGPGNNGGDGYVVARRCLTLGHEVRVFSTVDPDALRGDARTNSAAWLALGQEIARLDSDPSSIDLALAWCTIAVDALFGTGLTRDLDGATAELVGRFNAAAAFKVALDVPSGLDANTGRVHGAAIRADLTVTFAHGKTGLYGAHATDRVGKLVVVDIGVPASVSDEVGISATVTERSDVTAWLERRLASTHKGRAGRVLVIGGSKGKTGAAWLSARAALRAGAGLCVIARFDDAGPGGDAELVEVMTHDVPRREPLESLAPLLATADIVVVGPGLGLDAEARAVSEHVLMRHPGVVVGDADALTHFSERGVELSRAAGPRILTPHPGEMSRLLGIRTVDAEADRFQTLARAVQLTHAHVLYKGERTLVGAPEDLPCVNPTGTPALATAGSGDVLAGIVAAFACQLEPFEATVCAAYVHGLAGERWARAHGADRGLLAHEIADALPDVLGELLGPA